MGSRKARSQAGILLWDTQVITQPIEKQCLNLIASFFFKIYIMNTRRQELLWTFKGCQSHFLPFPYLILIIAVIIIYSFTYLLMFFVHFYSLKSKLYLPRYP